MAELLSVDLQTGMTATAAFPPLACRHPTLEAQEVVNKWGFETEYRFEDGQQRLYVGGRLHC